MKKLTLAAIAAALVGSMAPASADLTIPLLSYRTGPYAPNGIPYADGVTDYINMINARDGVLVVCRLICLSVRLGITPREV